MEKYSTGFDKIPLFSIGNFVETCRDEKEVRATARPLASSVKLWYMELVKSVNRIY